MLFSLPIEADLGPVSAVIKKERKICYASWKKSCPTSVRPRKRDGIHVV